MKKTLKVLLATAAISIMATVPAFAAEWLVDRDTYNFEETRVEWMFAEAKAQYDAWADANVAKVNEALTDTEKVKVAATLISDYLEHDTRYTNLHVYYVIKDHKGVCGHYAAMMQALLGKSGMTCYMVDGSAGQNGNYDAHTWNIVYIDGVPKWVDVTWYDTSNRMEKYLISDTLWDDHITDCSAGATASELLSDPYVSVATDRYTTTTGAGVFIEDGGSVLNFTTAPAGTVPVIGPNGKTVYISQADSDARASGSMTVYDLIAKYPELVD